MLSAQTLRVAAYDSIPRVLHRPIQIEDNGVELLPALSDEIAALKLTVHIDDVVSDSLIDKIGRVFLPDRFPVPSHKFHATVSNVYRENPDYHGFRKNDRLVVTFSTPFIAAGVALLDAVQDAYPGSFSIHPDKKSIPSLRAVEVFAGSLTRGSVEQDDGPFSWRYLPPASDTTLHWSGDRHA